MQENNPEMIADFGMTLYDSYTKCGKGTTIKYMEKVCEVVLGCFASYTFFFYHTWHDSTPRLPTTINYGIAESIQ